MKIKEIYPDVITEDTSYEYKAVLNPDNPIKWAKTLIGYANDKGGTLFIGVSNDGERKRFWLPEICLLSLPDTVPMSLAVRLKTNWQMR